MIYFGIIIVVIVLVCLFILNDKVNENCSSIFHPSLKTRVISTKEKHTPQILKRYLGFNWWGNFYYDYEDSYDCDDCGTIEHKIHSYSKFLEAKQHCLDAIKNITPSETYKCNITEIT